VLCPACAGEAPPPNVLVVSIDTLRADRLGCYGYARPTTPALDRLAREHAVRFAAAIAEAPWTLPSHVTMLSGLHPLTHGVRLPEEAPGDEVALLAERLADTHYAFAVTDGGWLSEPWGFARGFDSFHAGDVEVDRAVERVLEYVRHRQGKGPWLGFLHTYDVHCPYDPPPPYAGTFESPGAEPIEVAGRCGNPDYNALALTGGQARYLSDRYDEDVRRVDDALARLFAAFDELGLWEDTVLIVTSDHGEEFLEHGQIGHERTLNPEVLAVPLLVAAPGCAPRVVAAPVGLADLVPTVLELTRHAPARLDGRSLVPLLRGETDAARAPAVLSELAWQRELMAETSVAGSRVGDLAVPGPESEEWREKRARLLGGGYKPRTIDPTPHADELRGLGYSR
jgi:arylsulfatase A-like enzyme